MDLTLQIPDEIAAHMQGNAVELSRRALEAFTVEEYKQGRITGHELRQLLGFATSYQMDWFLKERGVYHEATIEDVMQDLEDLRRVGL